MRGQEISLVFRRAAALLFKPNTGMRAARPVPRIALPLPQDASGTRQAD
jgi:hypothetical protein